MDLDALQSDLRIAFRQLPDEVFDKLRDLVVNHHDVFATKLPAVLENLMPHIRSGIGEYAMGILDTKAIEACVMDTLKERDRLAQAG